MRILAILVLSCTVFASDDAYVGFVSDSGCALARAASGKFTPTNPDCARQCVGQGKKIVLIEPEMKTVLFIENPATLQGQVGNKVRLYGKRTGSRTLHVESVEFLEKTNPECERPPMKE